MSCCIGRLTSLLRSFTVHFNLPNVTYKLYLFFLSTDNEKLKGQLSDRENQLQALSEQLQRTRIDQSELMEETVDLYKVHQ
jgi:hypothetical protein